MTHYMVHEYKKKVLFGACDTFRAGVQEHLALWSEAHNIEIVAGKDKGDPAAVAFDTVSRAKARNVDLVLINRAGRLENKTELLKELEKIKQGFYNTDLPNLEISNMVSDGSSTSFSSSSSHVSSSTGTFQESSTAELLMKSWEPSTLKVYSSSYTRFRNFSTSNSLNPANITLVVFMDYLTHLFKHKPLLAFSTIKGHRSMLNQLLLLKNQVSPVRHLVTYLRASKGRRKGFTILSGVWESILTLDNLSHASKRTEYVSKLTEYVIRQTIINGISCYKKLKGIFVFIYQMKIKLLGRQSFEIKSFRLKLKAQEEILRPDPISLYMDPDAFFANFTYLIFVFLVNCID
ncbi:hypothetical protein ACTFIR_003808 [Dictyostelium discoideum]